MTDTTQLQLRRDTTANVGDVTPAQGEPIYDVTRKALVLGDGATAGGNCVTPFSGTWTPALKFGGTTVTGTTASGGWVQIGPLVVFWFEITLSAKNGSGAATIAGLPVAALSSVPSFSNMAYWANMATSPTFNSSVQNGNSFIILGKDGATGWAALEDTDFTTTAVIQGSGFYFASQPTG